MDFIKEYEFLFWFYLFRTQLTFFYHNFQIVSFKIMKLKTLRWSISAELRCTLIQKSLPNNLRKWVHSIDTYIIMQDIVCWLYIEDTSFCIHLPIHHTKKSEWVLPTSDVYCKFSKLSYFQGKSGLEDDETISINVEWSWKSCIVIKWTVQYFHNGMNQLKHNPNIFLSCTTAKVMSK